MPRPNLIALLSLLIAGTCSLKAQSVSATTSSSTATPPPPTSPTAAPQVDFQAGLAHWATQDYLFGDWDGYRTKLSKEYGIDFEFDYFSAVPTNFDGGFRTGTVYEGGLLATADIDFGKLAGFEGGHFHVGSLLIHGHPFSSEYVGDANQVSLLDLTHSLRLWDLWYEQKLLHDKLSIKFGLLGIDRDFIVPELYSNLGSINFLNQTFFYPTMAFNVFGRSFLPDEHHGLASTPFTTPGVRVRIDPDPHFYAQAGVYGGDPDRSYHGTEFDLNEQGGALSYFELGYRPQMAPGDQGMPGSYKIGAYYQTGRFSDNDALQGVFGLPSSGQTYQDNYGIYFLGEQTLYRPVGPQDPAQKGLVGFVRGGYAPPDRNLFEWGADGGLVYRGLIPTRDYDTCGIAASYLAVSRDLIDAQKTVDDASPGALPTGNFEGVVEVDYKIQMTAWMTVQASYQRIFHPGAQLSQVTPDANVVIIQTGLRF